MKTKTIAIVPAAGLGKRFNAPIKKTFIDLKGVPLVLHALMRLCEEQVITEIVPVLREEDIDIVWELRKKYGLHKIKHIARGGLERQDSIYNALQMLHELGIGPDTKILIHDGVRPFLPKGLILELIEELKNYDGAIPGFPVKETLKEVALDGTIISTVEREKLWAVQTPQAFYFKNIKKAYDTAYEEGYHATDDAALVERIGGRVKIIKGSPLNIKVTTTDDLEIVEYVVMKAAGDHAEGFKKVKIKYQKSK